MRTLLSTLIILSISMPLFADQGLEGAKGKYDKNVKKIQEAYEKDMLKEKKDLLGEYENAIKRYMKALDLENANAVMAEKKKFEEGSALSKSSILESLATKSTVKDGLIVELDFDSDKFFKDKFQVDGVNGPYLFKSSGDSNRVKGVKGTAIHFEKIGHLEAIINELPQGREQRTSSAWIKASPPYQNSRTPYSSVVEWGNCERGQRWFTLMHEGDGVIFGMHSHDMPKIAVPSDNNWHHLAWLWNGSEVKCYFDGTLLLSQSMNPNTLGKILCIGRNTSGKHNYGESFRGSIDEIKIFNRALSDDEIKILARQN